MIDVLFTSSNSLMASVVKMFTWSKYSHAGIVFTEGGVEWYISAKPNGGVVKQTLASFRREETIVAELRCPVVDLPLPDAAQVIAVAEDMASRQIPYDWIGCIGLGLHRDWQSTGKFWCSEFVAYVFNAAGFPLLGNEANIKRVTPQDLLLSPHLH